MPELPVLAEAVSDGTLSFDKATSVARVAAPSTEKALVELALYATVGQTRRICGQWRKVEHREAPAGTDEAAEHQAHQRPTVLVDRDEDGVTITAHFDHVEGELVLAALDAETTHVRRERKGAAPVDPSAANDPNGVAADADDRPIEKLSTPEWRALGLLRMAGRAGVGQPSGPDASGFDTTVVVHVGIDTLYGPDLPDPHDAGRSANPTRDEMAELEPGGTRLRRDVARFLACDAGLLTVLEDRDGNPLHIGRRTNPVPPALRKAVTSRYRTCTWPGCTSTAVQMHHIHHRSAGGHDDVECIVPECLDHHLAIHLYGIFITRDPDGTLHHWRPDGTEIVANPAVGLVPGADALTAPAALTRNRLELGGHPDETARQPRWQGDVLHLGDCIEAIETRRRRAIERTIPTRPTPQPLGLPPPSPN